MTERIVVLSDLHLGAGKRCVADPLSLRPLWDDATHLVLNGDSGEVHHVELRAAAARQVMRLLDALEQDGVPVTLLAGNHDPYITDIRHLHLADDQIFITHGDAFHPAISPWCPYAKRLRTQHDTAINCLPPTQRENMAARLDAIRFASHVEWLTEKRHRTRFMEMIFRPRNIFKLLHYWHQVPRLADKFVEQYTPKAKFVLFGHSHREGIWHIGDRVMINTGSYGFPGRPRGAIIEPGQLSIWAIHKRGSEYRFANKPLISFELEGNGPIAVDPPADVHCQQPELLLVS